MSTNTMLHRIAGNAFSKLLTASPLEKLCIKAVTLVCAVVTVNTAIFAQSTTFNYTGAVQTYTATSTGTLHIDMAGAKGGNYASVSVSEGEHSASSNPQAGGKGGRVVCSLAVTAGQVLNIYVGGAGQTQTAWANAAGGFNGGGVGTTDGSLSVMAGGGGGATDIRIGGTSLSDRVLVAGGGGGAGYAGTGVNAHNGGNGGGLTGANGFFYGANGDARCGFGGTPTSGGAGGVYVSAAASGSLGNGGMGASPSLGGGGGGGYYGGGGGSYSGGGGGSSFTHATLVTGVAHTQGYNNGNGYAIITPGPREAMNFDGGNDVIIAPNSSTLQLSSGTVEAWIRTTNAGSSWRGIFTKQYAYGVFLADNHLAVYDWSSFTPIGTGIYPNDGQWHHIAMTFNSGVTNGSSIYYDGAFVTNFTMAVSSQGVAPAVGGGSDDIAGYQSFAGDIDEVRVWNTIRTGSEISTYKNCDVAASSGLVLNYRFNEGNAGGTNTAMTKVADYSGRNNCGNLYNMALTGASSNFVTGAIATCNNINVSAAITGTTSICAGATSTLSNSVAGGTWSSSNPTVASVGTSGVVTGNTAGTAIISYTTCFSTATAVVTINAAPDVSAGSGVAVCTGNSATLTATGASTYVWTPATGLSATTGATVSASPTITTTYTVVGTTGSCSASATKTVTVNAYPTVGSITGITSIATGSTATLSNSTGGGIWTSASPSIATIGSTSGVVTGVTIGNATISYTVTTNGCATIATTNVTIFASENGIALNGTGSYVQTSNILASGESYTKEAWIYLANPALSNNIISAGPHPFWVPASHLRALQGSTDISDPAVFPFNVWTHVAVTYDAATTTMKLYKNGVVVASSTTASTYSAGAISVGAYLGGNFLGGKMDEVRIWNVARTQTQIQDNMTCDVPQNANLKAYYRFNQGVADGTNTGITSVIDYSGNGNCGTLVGFSLTGTTANFTSGMMGTCNTVNPVSAITGASTLCQGATTTFASTTASGTWTSSNASVAAVGSTTGVVSGIAAGTATISYSVCGITVTKVVSVTASPTVSAGSGVAICTGNATTLTASGATTYSWTPGTSLSASTGSSVTASPTVTTTYTVTGTQSGCSNSATVSVTVNSYPSVTAGTDTAICIGTSGVLTASGATTYTWAPSTGLSATTGASVVASPTVAATYTITGSMTGCSATATKTVSVNALPVIAIASFTPNPTLPGLPVNFTVSDGSLAAYSWSFGDASSSTVSNPSKAYGSAGTFIPTLTATNSNGCSASDTAVVTVLSSPGSLTGYVPPLCTADLSDTLRSIISGGTWSSSAPAAAAIGSATGILTAVAPGVATITYHIGAGYTQTVSVLVGNSPNPIFGPSSTCMGTFTGLNVLPYGSSGVWTSSNTAVATIGTGNGLCTSVSTGTTTITWTVPSGCYVTRVQTVVPSPAAISGPSFLCLADTASFSCPTPAGKWSVSNTGLATIDTNTGLLTAVATGNPVVSYTIAHGCASVGTVNIGALPMAITGGLVLCPGGTSTLASATSGGVWTSGNTSVATVGSTTGLVTAISGGTASITYTIGSGCRRVSTVTVNAALAANTGSPEVCVGGVTTLTNATSGGWWTSSATSVATVGSAGTIAGRVTGVSAGNVNITYQLSTPGCRSITTVTVNAAPAAISGPTSICVGTTATLTHAVSGGTWLSSNIAIATIDSATGIVSGIAAGTVTTTYSITPSCYTTRTFTVKSIPSAISGSPVVCIGVGSTLSSTPTGGTWSSSNTSLATVHTISGLVSGVASGTPTVTYTGTNGCIRTVEVTVNSLPATITGTLSVCIGGTTTLGNATSGGTWSTSSTKVTVDSATGVVTGVTAGTAVVSYTAPTGCRRTATVTVNAPTASISGTLTMCAGGATTLSTSTGGGTWSSGDTSVAYIGATTSTTATVISAAAGTANINYTLGGCTVTTAVSVSGAAYAISGVATMCLGGSATFTTAGSGGTWSSSTPSVATVGTSGLVTAISTGTAIITYSTGATCFATFTTSVSGTTASITGTTGICVGQSSLLSHPVSGGTWSSSNSSVASVNTAGNVSGITSGSATITYTIAAGCFKTTTVYILSLPAAIGGASSVCEGNSTTLTNSTSGGSWISSTPSVATVGSGTGSVYGVATGTTTITFMVASSGCYVTRTQVVNTAPTIVSAPSFICATDTATLTASPSGGTWASMNTGVVTVGSTSGLVTGIAAGTTTLTYTLSTGCATGASVTAGALPGTITGLAAVCPGGSITLSSATGGGTWTSTDASVATINSTTGLVNAVDPGVTTISYTSASGCVRIAALTVSALPSAISGSTSVCVGGSVALTSATSGGTWSSSSSSVATVGSTGNVTGVTAGNAIVTYSVAGNGCFTTHTISVNSAPATITGTTNACVGTTSALGNPVSGGTWVSGNTSLASVDSATGVVTGVAAGTPNITYYLSASCYTSVPFTVKALPSAITGTLNVCPGTSGVLASGPSGGGWISSDPAIAVINASTGAVTGVIAGTVSVSYSTSNGCSRVAVVTVNPLPDTISGVATVCAGATTTLSSTSTGGSWITSNAAIATVGSGSGIVTGVSAGSATISYVLPTGCRVTKVVSVSVPPSITGTGTVCMGNRTTLSCSVYTGTWSSASPSVASIVGTGASTVAATASVQGNTMGTAVISYHSGGCVSTATVTVNAPVPGIYGVSPICVGNTATFYTGATGGTWSSSATALATVSTTGVVTGVTAGGPVVIRYTTNPTCFASYATSVVANPSISGPSTVCIGATATLSHPTSGGTWSSSNTSLATVNSSGVVTGVAAGSVLITYYAAAGCFKVKSLVVNVAPPAIVGNGNICLGSYAPFSITATGGTWGTSNSSVATVNTAGGVTGVGVGTATIYYLTTSGCAATKVATVSAPISAITGPSTICKDTYDTLVAPVSGGTWSSSHSTIVSLVSYSAGIIRGNSVGTARITYTAPTGCSQTATVTVLASPGLTGTNYACNGNYTRLNATITGGSWSNSNPGASYLAAVSGYTNYIDVYPTDTGSTLVTYTAPNGCTAKLNVALLATPTISGPAQVCGGTIGSYSTSMSGGTWTLSTPPAYGTLNATTGQYFASSSTTSGWNQPVTINYTYSSTCKSSRVINAVNTIFSATPATCTGSTMMLTASPAGGTWSSSNTSVATISYHSATASNSYALRTGVSAGTAIITYAIGSCGRAQGVTVSSDNGSISGSSTVCAGLTTSFGAVVAGGTWSVSNAAIATINATTGLLTGVSAGSVNVTYNRSTCTSMRFLTVKPLPAALAGPTAVCAGSTITLASTTTGGTWASTPSSTATVNSSGVVTGVAAGTATISYHAAGCYRTAAVTVRPLPVITGHSTIAVGSSRVFLSSISGARWSSSATSIATVGSVNGIVSGMAAGSAIITCTIPATTCSSTFPVTITSGARPELTDDLTIAEFSMYPNPSEGALNVRTGIAGILQVLSIDGKLVASFDLGVGESAIQLSSDLTAGSYLCRFVGADGSIRQVRMVLQR